MLKAFLRMIYEGNIIRPPSEANSIILQVTVGCSHNKCTFCGAYQGQRFKIKSEEYIDSDINFTALHYREKHRLFLCDGDAMIIPQEKLLGIFRKIKNRLPWIRRVGIYANIKSLRKKSVDDLISLKELGLGIVYMGLETGDNLTLEMVNKGATSPDMIEQGRKVRTAKIKLSITVLLGIAGKTRSVIHAQKTGEVLSEIDPNYVGALSLMLIPGTPMYRDWEAGTFTLPEPEDLLTELKTMIEHTNLTGGLFFANHASNYLPIKARLPKDKKMVIQLINEALAGKISLKPEWLRGL